MDVDIHLLAYSNKFTNRDELKSNGITSIAHPGQFYNKIGKERFISVITDLIISGLDAIELTHPRNNSNELREVLTEYAKNNGIIFTGVSDFHSELDSHVSIRSYGISRIQLNKFLNRLQNK